MKIGVIGAGAVGLYFGSLLQRSGQDLHYLLRSDYEAIRTNGLKVHSVNGDYQLASLQAYNNPADMGQADLVLVTLKTVANHCMVDLVRPLVGPHTMIMTLQNGLGNEELLAAAFGAKNILGAVTYLGAARKEAGVLEHSNAGKLDLGEFSSLGVSTRCEQLAAIFVDAGIPCRPIADLRRQRWEKLGWNIPFNGLCALLNQDTAQLLGHPQTRELTRKIIIEVVTAANAQGLQSPIDIEKFSSGLISYTSKIPPYRPSMLVDRDEGRAMELESIFAVPLAHARNKGVDMPLVDMLYAELAGSETATLRN